MRGPISSRLGIIWPAPCLLHARSERFRHRYFFGRARVQQHGAVDIARVDLFPPPPPLRPPFQACAFSQWPSRFAVQEGRPAGRRPFQEPPCQPGEAARSRAEKIALQAAWLAAGKWPIWFVDRNSTGDSPGDPEPPARRGVTRGAC